METVSVSRDVLMADLHVRMEAHRQSWEAACRARDEGIVKEMRRRVRVWKRTGVMTRLGIDWTCGLMAGPPGQQAYRKALSFLELADTTVQLNDLQVERFVEDIWPWTADWQRTIKELGVV